MKRHQVRRAIFFYLAKRGASHDDLIKLTGYTRNSVHVMCGQPAARFNGLRASKARPTPVHATAMNEYQELVRTRKVTAARAAELAMGVE